MNFCLSRLISPETEVCATMAGQAASDGRIGGEMTIVWEAGDCSIALRGPELDRPISGCDNGHHRGKCQWVMSWDLWALSYHGGE